jgi:hypothetical protein
MCLISLGCQSSGNLPLPPNANYIPSDAFAVATLDAVKLIKQAKLDQKDSILGRALRSETGLRYMDDIIQVQLEKLIKDPGTYLGIDESKPILAWAKAQESPSKRQEARILGGLLVPLNDPEKIEALLNTFGKMVELKPKGGYKTYVSQDIPVALGIKDNKLIVAMAIGQSEMFGGRTYEYQEERNGDASSDGPAQTNEVPWQKPLMEMLEETFDGSSSKLKDAKMEEFLRQPKDAGFYVNMGSIFEMMSKMMPEEVKDDPEFLTLKALMVKAAMGWRIYFDKGEASVSGVFYHEDIKEDWGGNHKLSGLKDLVSGDSQLLMGTSLNTSKLASYYENTLKKKILGSMRERERESFSEVEEEIKQNTGHSIPSLIRILDGNLMGSLTGISLEGNSEPRFVVGAGSSDKDKVSELLERFSEVLEEIKEEVGVSVGQSGERLRVSNSDPKASRITVDKERFKFLSSHDLAIHSKGGLTALMMMPFPIMQSRGADGYSTTRIPLSEPYEEVPPLPEARASGEDETPDQQRARRIAEEKAQAALAEIERKEQEARIKKEQALQKERQAKEQALQKERQAKVSEALSTIKAAMLALDFENGAVRLSYTLQTNDPDKNSLRTLVDTLSSILEMEKEEEEANDSDRPWNETRGFQFQGGSRLDR